MLSKSVRRSGPHKLQVGEGLTMDSVNRQQLVTTVTYYAGWLTAICGGLVHFTLGAAMFRTVDLTKRNLFEASVMFFVISIASAVRVLAASRPD